jgi:hypothetical protein
VAYVRIVFDLGVGPESYDAIVQEAERQGVVVVGQVFDSAYMRHATVAEFETRWRSYVDHFPDIHIWEVGNEVNGEWLGSDVPEKVAFAARYVKATNPNDTTILTLFWQMGTADSPANSVFQCARRRHRRDRAVHVGRWRPVRHRARRGLHTAQRDVPGEADRDGRARVLGAGDVEGVVVAIATRPDDRGPRRLGPSHVPGESVVPFKRGRRVLVVLRHGDVAAKVAVGHAP